MYRGAALMWCVDGFFSVAGGESFPDLSLDDALPGIIIVLCGPVAWIVLLLVSDPEKVFGRLLLKSEKTEQGRSS